MKDNLKFIDIINKVI